MNCSEFIYKMSRSISGDEFIDLFLIPKNNGKLYLSVNEEIFQYCPIGNKNSDCIDNCYICWKKFLSKNGYIFKEDFNELVNKNKYEI